MTIIAAAVDRSGGFIASDSAVCNGPDGPYHLGFSKLLRPCNGFTAGFTGTSGFAQMVRVEMFDALPSSTTPTFDAVPQWWWEVCGRIRARGYCAPPGDHSAAPLVDGCGLAVSASRIWLLGSDGACVPIDDDCAGVGIGAAYGIGAMYAARRRNARARVEVAVSAACRYSDGCRGPVHMLGVG